MDPQWNQNSVPELTSDSGDLHDAWSVPSLTSDREDVQDDQSEPHSADSAVDSPKLPGLHSTPDALQFAHTPPNDVDDVSSGVEQTSTESMEQIQHFDTEPGSSGEYGQRRDGRVLSWQPRALSHSSQSRGQLRQDLPAFPVATDVHKLSVSPGPNMPVVEDTSLPSIRHGKLPQRNDVSVVRGTQGQGHPVSRESRSQPEPSTSLAGHASNPLPPSVGHTGLGRVPSVPLVSRSQVESFRRVMDEDIHRIVARRLGGSRSGASTRGHTVNDSVSQTSSCVESQDLGDEILAQLYDLALAMRVDCEGFYHGSGANGDSAEHTDTLQQEHGAPSVVQATESIAQLASSKASHERLQALYEQGVHQADQTDLSTSHSSQCEGNSQLNGDQLGEIDLFLKCLDRGEELGTTGEIDRPDGQGDVSRYPDATVMSLSGATLPEEHSALNRFLRAEFRKLGTPQAQDGAAGAQQCCQPGPTNFGWDDTVVFTARSLGMSCTEFSAYEAQSFETGQAVAVRTLKVPRSAGKRAHRVGIGRGGSSNGAPRSQHG